MKKTELQTLKGFRDFLPERMKIRNQVIKALKSVFEDFGFEPLETSSLEYAEVLLGKYGEEADKLVYTFEDKGKRRVGLRYDLTVPTARVLAQYQNEITLPFKRYQIQPVWRAEKPQKGRYREFTQCDIDSFGIAFPLADAEIIAVIYASLRKLGLEQFSIKINSRQILFSLLENLSIKDANLQNSVLQSIDKLEKKGETLVRQELMGKGMIKETIDQLFKKIASVEPDDNLKKMFDFINGFGVPKKYYQFAPSMVRGLDYYTGPIFETVIEKPQIGSITGGGRYDKLISQLGGPDIPATGTTIGLDRICDVISELGLLKMVRTKEKTVLITVFNESFTEESLALNQFLREQGIKANIYPEPKDSLRKQIKYAEAKKIPAVTILGPDEIKNNQVSIKFLNSKKQEMVKREDLSNFLTTRAVD